MSLSSAYLLVSHGSSDSRPQIGLERLAYLVEQKLGQYKHKDLSLSYQFFHNCGAKPGIDTIGTLFKSSLPLVGTATLEVAPHPLHQSIEIFAQKVRKAGLNRIYIVPLFLLPGVHVREDIPRQVDLAQKALGSELILEVGHHLGSYPKISQLLARQFRQLSSQRRIILAHGSRLREGNEAIEKLASGLAAIAAYWSIPPSLAQQVEVLVQQESKSIAILPYFLFSAGITDALAQQVQQLRQRFPQVELKIGNPLGATAQLAQLIVQQVGELNGEAPAIAIRGQIVQQKLIDIF